ncbi:MAG: ribosome small subunit-dependent GTPase A [Chloroflexota bacterium]
MYEVHTSSGVLACSLSARLRKELIYSEVDLRSGGGRVKQVKTIEHSDPVAIGDVVRYVDAQDGSGMIVEILPRRTKLARRAAGPSKHAFEQVIVANVDQVVAVMAVEKPTPKWALLDRYLVSAEAAELPALVCITKMDLLEGDEAGMEELQTVVGTYRKIGYPVVLTSTVSGDGLEAFGAALQGRLSVLLGKSGVGKSSLLNHLQPGLGLRVNQVSQSTGKGKHTTTHLEMFELDTGGMIVDTPGMREFGLWEVSDEDLAYLFPEMRAFIGRCRFGLDCQHDEEPGCALRKAVMAGQVSPYRYQSYLRLREDV